jgi:hypothetical protein
MHGMKWRIGIVWIYNLDKKKMENIKLDLTKLTPVAEENRVKGNWYVVADDMGQNGRISQWYSGNSAISHVRGCEGVCWAFWFAIPPNLPGFPVQELSDKIELPLSEWSYSYNQDVILLHRKKRMFPTLVLPAGTIEERKKRLQDELEKLNSL